MLGLAGDDFLDGDGFGIPFGDFDHLDGGPDFDVCVNGESVVNCEEIGSSAGATTAPTSMSPSIGAPVGLSPAFRIERFLGAIE